MGYFIPNLGRARTSKRNIECIAGDTGLTATPTIMARYREVGEPWSPWQIPTPYFTIELSEDLGTKTLDYALSEDAGATTAETHTYTVELVEVDSAPSWHPETQRIANKLPQFHKGRRIRNSNWQLFMNGLGAAGSELLADVSQVLNGRYIQTCPLDELTRVGVVYPDSDKLNAVKEPNSNRLTNPSMTLHRAPFLEPQDWALRGEWVVDTAESLFGYNCLRCQPGVGEQVTAVQSTTMHIATGETLTAGLFYQTSLASSTSPLSAVDFSLVVVLLYEDGDSEVSSVILQPGTDTRWHLAQLSITATKHVTKVFTALVIEGQATISPFPLHVGGIQLRKGGNVGAFSFGATTPFTLDNPTTNALEPTKELWFVDSAREFSKQLIPTRVGSPSSPVAGTFTANAVINPIYRLHTGHLDVAPIGYAPSNDKIGMFVTEPEELLLEFNVAFYDQGAEGYIQSDGFIIETTYFFGGKLWATGYFEDQTAANEFLSIIEWEGFGEPVNGTNRLRYLLCINHLPPAVPRTYLEVLAAFPLAELDVSNPIVDLSFRNSDGSVVYYRTATEERYSRLYYDYALAATDGSVWLRESDSIVSLT